MEWTWIFWFTVATINIIAFAIMGIDKSKARKGSWRIPEKTLFLLALAGGSLGILCGMYFFHHKTQHWQFKWGIPLIMAAQAALLFWK